MTLHPAALPLARYLAGGLALFAALFVVAALICAGLPPSSADTPWSAAQPVRAAEAGAGNGAQP